MAKKQKKFDIRRIFIRTLLEIFSFASLIVGIVFFIKNPVKLPEKVFIPFCIFIVLLIIAYLNMRHFSRLDGMTRLINSDQITIEVIYRTLFKKIHFYDAVFINVKNFKYINRMVGDTAGDGVLIEYARRLKSYLIKGEIVGRMGGDNFFVLVYKHRLNDFLEFLSKIYIEAEGDKQSHKLHVPSRAGIYAIAEHDHIGDIFTKSNIAMNYSKMNVMDDYIWFKQSMADELFKEHEIAILFQAAIKNKEFKIVYQPRIDIVSNKLQGAEALVRWQKGEKLIKPQEFLPVLERTGLITLLDMYVLEQVCVDLAQWEEQKMPYVPVSINFSRLNLRNRDFAQEILAMCTRYKINNSYLEIELTKSPVRDDAKLLQIFLEHMADARIGTIIDDFGKSFSSLALLKELNVGSIKLERSFIEGIEVNNGSNPNALLVGDVIRTCHDLKKKIICEGIENVEQRDLLRDMRCTLVQGFLYDQPLTKKEFEGRMLSPVYFV